MYSIFSNIQSRLGHRRGFVLVEMLFSLMIASIVLFLLLVGIRSLLHLNIEINDYTDIVIASKQLSQELMMSEITSISEDSISFTNVNNSFTLSLNNDVLVKEPGYVVYLYDVDAVYFIDDEVLKMGIERNGEVYEQVIAILPEE